MPGSSANASRLAEDPRPRSPIPSRGRPWAYVLHSLFGLWTSLFFLFICLTGTLAVVSDEIEWLYRPEVRAAPGAGSASWGRQLRAAQEAFPDHAIEYATAGEASFLATRFSATDALGHSRVIYVDPSTARVTGESDWVSLQSFLRALHSYLFTPGDWGFYLVTSLGIVLTVSLVTGISMARRWWRVLLRAPRRRRARVFWGDLHRLVAAWSLWFVAVFAATSLWYLVERAMYRAGVDPEPVRPAIAADALDALGPEPPVRLPLDELVSIAKTHVPGLDIREIWFPSEPGDALSILGQTSSWLLRDRAQGVDLDPYRGTVLAVRRAADMPLLVRWLHTADPLHFGDFGGLASKLVWVVFGSALCLLSLSGVVVHLRRTAASPVLAGIAPRGSLPAWWWPNVVAALAVPAAAYAMHWGPQYASPPTPTLRMGSVSVGSWNAEAGPAPDTILDDDADMTWHVKFCRGCRAGFRSAAVAFGTATAAGSVRAELSGSGDFCTATLPVPQLAAPAPTHLWLEVRGWDDRIYKVAWRLPHLEEAS